jgi:predicted RNA-binding protein associated with RNAse of E/G family
VDLCADMIVTTDRRPYRLLDLDEYADAIRTGDL